ncbi:isochorismatase family protein [Salinactinospora qingdaonensis]|uniref:N-carbamoylsarcosine amidohydrolase n=1 Tax=Salinactinospora qingdaonensis TaxID=702744 RepID=A0ABP7FHE5_9ACTN
MADHPSGALAADYERAGFGGEIGMGRAPALLVVDLVRAYLDPDCSLYAGVEHIVEPVTHLADAARHAGVPVVFTYVHYRAGGADGGWFYRKVPALRLFEAGSPWGDPPAELAPQPTDLTVTKQYPSAFAGTSLAAVLTSLGVDSVVVTGVSTSGCVRATVVDAISLGLRPIVVSDAVGDRDPGPHEANLFDMRTKYADLRTSEQLLATWRAESSE